MENLDYTSKQKYESLCTPVNILGIDVGIDEILPTESPLTVKDLWGSRILIIKPEEEPEEIELSKRLVDPEYGSLDLNAFIHKTEVNIISIEEARKITDRLPSLTKILIEDRYDE